MVAGKSDSPGSLARSYSLSELTRLFQEHSDNGGGDDACLLNLHLAEKHHLAYFDEYLQAIGTKTIVVEADYIDRDFLEDFAAYHVRSFYGYSRRCARLHFFTEDFDDAALIALIENRPDAQLPIDRLRQSYRGFLVIKPLPSTVVGRTCLATYSNDEKAFRRYPVTGNERVDLYGLRLNVETLPFQEQDRDVAACASSALWSIFHATGRLFQHAFPSPAQITGAATLRVAQDDRVLPNGNGLTSRQIADAIRSVQLEPYLLNLGARDEYEDDEDSEQRLLTLQIAAAAYLSARIPSMLLMNTYDDDQRGTQPQGKHAVAVTGYRLPRGAKPKKYRHKERQEEDTKGVRRGTYFAATRMEKLYVHDDQVGPFARMTFRTDKIETSQVNKKGERYKIVAQPRMLMVPLYHKIRIPFDQIMRIAIAIDHQLQVVRDARDCPGLPNDIVWDLRLVTLEDYRRRIRDSALPPERKKGFLLKSMPRFLWLLTAQDMEDRALFDLLFDPTDLLQGRLFLEAVDFDGAAYVQFVAAMAFVDEKEWLELPLSTIRKRLYEIIPNPESSGGCAPEITA